jgi:glycosyltransferase involved in cell wall biosynthesis
MASEHRASHRPGVSVIMTIFNEAGSIRPLLDSLLTGTVIPDEVVVADGGSTDATREIVGEIASANPAVRLIEDAGDRARGRNAAVRAAAHSRIAAIDGGCTPRTDWLQHMVAAFDRGAEWVGGFYEPVGETPLSTAIGLTMVYVREEAERHFVPSARSLGFTRELWAEVGGFAEGLQFAEDTLFADELYRRGHTPVFVPEAVVEWHPPENLAQQSRTMFNWGYGDGLQGLRSRHYLKLLILGTGQIVLLVIAALIDARLVPVAALPLLGFVVRSTRDKYRHMVGTLKWVLIPLAAVNGTVSSLVGFLTGRRARQRAKAQ